MTAKAFYFDKRSAFALAVMAMALVAGAFVIIADDTDAATPATYTVSFKGADLDDIEVEGGTLLSNVISSVNPQKEGYEFIGFYLDKNFSIRANEFMLINKDVTLYAQWYHEESECVVMFMVYGDNFMDIQYVVVDKNTKVSQPADPKLAGYTFVGWYVDEDEEYDFNEKVTGQLYLYAVWAPAGFVDVLMDNIVTLIFAIAALVIIVVAIRTEFMPIYLIAVIPAILAIASYFGTFDGFLHSIGL